MALVVSGVPSRGPKAKITAASAPSGSKPRGVSWWSSQRSQTDAADEAAGVFDRGLVHHDLVDVGRIGQLEHGVDQRLLQDGTQAPGPGFAGQRPLGDGAQGIRPDFQVDAFHGQQLAVLLDQCVLGLGEDLHQGVFAQFGQSGNHGHPPDQFGMRPNLIRSSGSTSRNTSVRLRCALLFTAAPKPMPEASVRCSITFSRPEKAPPQMNRMLVVSICRKSWLGCLRPPCGGTLAMVPSISFQQGLLHTLARHVAGDGGVVGFAGNLVDFVDVDDAALGTLDLVVAALQQLLDDVLDVLADVAGFGQRRRVGHDERHIEHARQRLGQQRLARARGADQENVALGELDVVLLGLFLVAQALVVVVHGHRQATLGRLLADDVMNKPFAAPLKNRNVGLASSAGIGLDELPIALLERGQVIAFLCRELMKHRPAADILGAIRRSRVELEAAAFGGDGDAQGISSEDELGRRAVDRSGARRTGATLLAHTVNLDDRLGGRELAGGRDFFDQRLDVRAQKLGRAMTVVANEMEVPWMSERRLVPGTAFTEIHLAGDAGFDHPLQRAVDRRAPDAGRLTTYEIEQIVGAQVAFLLEENPEDLIALA